MGRAAGKGVCVKHLGKKLLDFYHMSEKMVGLVKVGILENSDGQMTTNQFLPKSPPKKKYKLASPTPNPIHTNIPVKVVFPRAETLHPGTE